MHVAQIGFFEDPLRRRPERLLEDWPTLVDVAECASAAGARVSVIQACSFTQSINRRGVQYHFLPWRSTAARLASGHTWGHLIHTLRPDLFHVHGLHFPQRTMELANLSPGTPILLQDHASRPPALWRRMSWRRCSQVLSGVAFCALEQARPFIEAGLFRGSKVYQIPESTCRFSTGDAAEARKAAALTGDPLALWVGHLDGNKDPIAVLDGISRAARSLPELTLYCCFARAPLLRTVERSIGADPMLRGRVRLLGAVSHARIEQLMRAADVFVLGSHREGSGYALIEALACGLPPAVTDIPSFRALTGGGAVGALWPCGDSRALAEALVSLAPRLGPDARARVRAHFERHLAPAALGAQWRSVYADLTSSAAASDPPARRPQQPLRERDPGQRVAQGAPR